MHLRQQALRVDRLKKVFRSGAAELVLFENLSFEVAQGEMLAIVGQSGAGKSTLLHIAGALDKPSAGEVYFGDLRLNSLSENEAADFRNREIGFVWQFHYLLPEFTALENVGMPLLMRGSKKPEAEQAALTWLGRVGLRQRAYHRAGELSGGEQQRAALARALANRPKLLLADEPTGNLDTKNSENVLGLLRQLNKDLGQTIVMITHNPEAAAYGNRVLHMRDGLVVDGASAN